MCFLYTALVKTQVESQASAARNEPLPMAPYASASNTTLLCPQIKVRDLSRQSVSIQPAEYSSWADARAELISEAKRPLTAQLEAALDKADTEDQVAEIRANFAEKEAAIEHTLDHKPLEMHLSMSIAYKCALCLHVAPRAPVPVRAVLTACAPRVCSFLAK